MKKYLITAAALCLSLAAAHAQSNPPRPNDTLQVLTYKTALAVTSSKLATNPSAHFSRPGDTTAYASGDLVANSTTAASVAAMIFTVTSEEAGSFMLRRVVLAKSGTSVTNASFRIHLFRAAPVTVTNGDNGVFSVSGIAAGYLGAFDVTVDRAFTDGAAGVGFPVNASEITIKLTGGTRIFGLVEARAAYTPVNGEVFTFFFDDLQN